VLFLEHRELLATKGAVPEEEYFIDFGQAAVVRAGSDVTVVALALMVHRALEARARCSRQRVSPSRSLIPERSRHCDLDEHPLKSVAKTGRLLVVDEAFGPCGIGAEIAAQVSAAGFDELDAPIRRLNGAHSPTPYSPPLEAAVVPSVESIAQEIRARRRSDARRTHHAPRNCYPEAGLVDGRRRVRRLVEEGRRCGEGGRTAVHVGKRQGGLRCRNPPTPAS
jgi:pyruvate/2-oxoglutarate/acetoin dehydrogenase E1 component